MAVSEKHEQKKFFQTGTTLDYEFRYLMLKRFKDMIKTYEPHIVEAMQKDFNKPAFETYATEILMLNEEVNYMLKNLKQLMKPKKVSTPLIHFYSRSKIYPEPLGQILIISPWNYPFMLGLSPVIGAIAAGNTVVLKPSEISSHSSKVMKEMIQDTYPSFYIQVVEGAAETTQELIRENFDHILFTGSAPVAKEVAKTASDYLTPLTLELGGKSPAIVSSDADLVKTAVRIAWGKTINAGQTCIAPDYVLVHESVKQRFIALVQFTWKRLYGDTPLENDDFPSIVNEKHFERLLSLLDNQYILYGGKTNSAERKLEPTMLDEPDLHSPVMQEEIFGPVLPVISYTSMDEVVEIVRNRPKPLALYLFSESRELKEYVVKHLSFGGGSINDTLIHVANPELPFGGVGNSGMGQYHGKYSFETFSHAKSITEKTTLFDMPFRYPPYTRAKTNLLKLLIKLL